MIKPIGKRLFIKQDPQPEKKGNIILLEKKLMMADKRLLYIH